MSTAFPIIIIGTGISGLAFAQGLRKASIPFRLFERDAHLNLRSQGYRVRIQGPGVTALDSLLAPEHCARVKATAPELISQGMGPLYNLDALTANEIEGIFGGPGPNRSGPGRLGAHMAGAPQPLNQDRTTLRNVLMQGLETHVTFGKEFLSYEVTSSAVIVKFSDGSEVEGSLLVGADGARSRLKRQFLPEHHLVDTEGRILYGKTTITPELENTFQEKALRGMIVVIDKSTNKPLNLLMEAIRFDRNQDPGFELPENYIYWVLMARKDRLPDTGAMLHLSAAEAAKLASELTSDWDSSFRPLFGLQNPGQTALLRILSVKPELPVWEPSDRVTLIGDAVHAMSPTAGSGATTALRDAAALAEAIKEGGTHAKSIGKYEAGMREYVKDVVAMSQIAGAKLFGMPKFEDMESAEFDSLI